MGHINNLFIGILSIILINYCQAQENAETRVTASLMECYRLPLLDRDNRLPMTMAMLIELIRKVENTPGYNTNIHQLSVSLLHRFRQDGIEFAEKFAQNPNVLPFSPSGFQFSKSRFLLQRLIPGSAQGFPNDTLTAVERCSLHFMLSSTFELRVRGDESTRCGQLAQYRYNRGPRDVESFMNKQNDALKGMVDIDDIAKLRKFRRIQFVEGDDESDLPIEAPVESETEHETINTNFDGRRNNNADTFNTNNNNNDAVSQCPVESGIVSTNWGTISAGSLLAGIAAGVQAQTIQIKELIELRKLGDFAQAQTVGVDNRFAATLTGDLAEVALFQAPSGRPIVIGAAGSWNSTTIPRWYFLSRNRDLEMTDAEIRGGLDGLILAMNIQKWRQQSNTMKLSQLLSMYYSPRGILSRQMRACNRNAMFTTVAPINQLRAQSAAFSIALDKVTQLAVSITLDGIGNFSNAAVESLSQYIPQLTEFSCAFTETVDQTRPSADISIFLDTTFTYRDIQPYIANILDNIDVQPLGTTYTLLSANPATIIVNRTNSLSDLYRLWNLTTHQIQPVGLNLPDILRYLRQDSLLMLDNERINSSVGGRSHIALIITNTADVDQANTNFALQQVQVLREESPDLRLIFVAGGTQNRFAPFVQDEQRDIYPINIVSGPTNTIQTQVSPIVQRIQQIPRRVINHRCGSNWVSNSDRGNNQMITYVEPNSINYYRIHPNYFYGQRDDQRVRVQGMSSGTISVCSSRTNQTPRMNGTANTEDVTCRQINSESFDIDLSNACGDYSQIYLCPPQYFSVEGISAGDAATFTCNDEICPYPDSIRFSINTENLECFSGVEIKIISGPTNTIQTQVSPIVQRIQQIPRRVINHRCGSNWVSNSDRGNNQMITYVEPNSINYYRIHPNYFYGQRDDQRVRVQGMSSGTISVCSSRTNQTPRMNGTANTEDVTCRQINSESFDIDLSNACGDYSQIYLCPPQYFSVEGISAGDAATFTCNDEICPYPDSIRFGINTENLECFSGVGQILISLPLIIVAVLFSFC